MRACWLIGVAVCGGCLPVDTRPPPAEVEITASSSAQTREGIAETVDGYRIDFERVLVNVGQPEVSDFNDNGGGCSEYSNPNYTRLFDFVAVESPQEVGLAYAIGACPFGFVVRFPNLDTLLGTGATEADRDYMRTAGDDPFAQDAGVSIGVIGKATGNGVTKTFAWAFRERIGYQNCYLPAEDATDGAGGTDGTEKKGLVLEGNGHAQVNLEMQAEALFRDQLDPALGVPRFQPFADADANGDGEVTLDELDHVKLSDYPDSYRYPRGPAEPDTSAQFDCADSDGNLVPVDTLGDYAYCALAPSIARYEGTGFCDFYAGRRRRN